jgi:aminotransferase
LITVGVSEALDLLIRAICAPGDEVLYHEPCFVSYNPTIRLAHAVPVAVETYAQSNFRLTVDELEKKVTPKTKALILNFPCNPTGATLNDADMRAIADFAIKHDILIVADEVYSELAYDGNVRSFASIPEIADRLVVLNGFSKAWAMTGFRLGFACGPVEIIDMMMKIHQYGIMSAPTLSQFAGVEALNRGDDDIAAMREEYRRRRNFIVASMNELGLKTFMPEGAFYIFPDITSTGLDSHTFALRLLEEHAVACVPGSAFGACGEGFIRCSYATSMEKLKIAAERFANFVRSLV